MRYVYFLISLVFLTSCSNKPEEITAEEIVDNAIKMAGGERYKHASIAFDFRNINYKSIRNNGEYRLERTIKDTAGNNIHDVLDNHGFKRFVKDTVVKIKDSLATAYANSVNSVHYFVQLPFGLNAKAANKRLLGKDTIAGREYYEIKVTFSENGGGVDYEDEYLYWIDTRNFEVDYLAYSFKENDGGLRFRKAFNHRIIEGIRFVDYENYKYDNLTISLEDLDSLYEKRELDLLSLIETRNIEVKLDAAF